ncbi:hypothetical protein Tco_1268272 [Tanacetum coccineum]
MVSMDNTKWVDYQLGQFSQECQELLWVFKGLLVAKPTNLEGAFELAWVTKAQLDDQRVLLVSNTTTTMMSGGPPRATSSRIGGDGPQSGKSPILQNLTPVTNAKPLAINGEGDEPGPESNKAKDDAVESGDIFILNTLIGHGSPRSL